MKNLTLMLLLFLGGTAYSQTPFVVTNRNGERVPDTDVYRDQTFAGKTDAMGKITLKTIVKGELILFRHQHEEFLYTAPSDNPEAVQTISLKPLHMDEMKVKDGGSPYGSDAVPPPPPEDPGVHIFSVVDVPAEFPGGREALLAWIDKNLVYPETAKQKKIEGKCYLRFVVTREGSISNVQLQRGIPDCPECGEEAKRLVKSMPKWIPGKDRGNAVHSYYTLPIFFKLKP